MKPLTAESVGRRLLGGGGGGAGAASGCKASLGERIGAAKAEAVIEHALRRRRTLRSLALCGTRSTPMQLSLGVVEVERRRHDLIAHREHAEDRFDRAGGAEQVADGGLGRRHRHGSIRAAEQALTAPSSISSPSGVEVPCALT
jgi:hypothetical protein